MPEVRIIEGNSHDLTHEVNEHNPSKHPTTSSKTFLTLFGNITSFSNHAQEYLFSLPTDNSVLMLCEVHKEANSVHNIFRTQGFSTSYNPPEDTDKGGTHGGEQ